MPLASRLTLGMVSLMPWAHAAGAAKADYVFKNGAIYTQEARNAKVEAVAIQGKQIAYVGSSKGVAAFIGKKTKVIDLQGRMLLPGFVESHTHPALAFLAAGADMQADSLEEALAPVKAWADAHPEAKVIRGFGWRYTLFPTTGPTREVLDKLFPDRPALLVGIDGHSAWVNSKTLQLAGITAQHPDPAPGVSYYQRDPKTNEPTGWVVETPAELEVLAKLDPPTPEAIIDAMAEVLPKFSAAGITAVWDAGIGIMSAEKGFEGYQKLEKEGRLPQRVVGCYYWNTSTLPDPIPLVQALHKRFSSELVQLTTLKVMFDGGDAQHTAVMLQPYADRPGFLGEYAVDPVLVKAAVMKAQSIGLDTHAHCYGDATIRTYLDAVEAARNKYPKSPSRHAAAHVVYLADADVPRFAKLDVTFQTSAEWAMPDPTMLRSAEIVGKDLAFKELYRINSVLKAGGRVAFGTDWPASGYTSTFRPLDAIQVAVTRAILPQYGKAQFRPILPPEDERITVAQALKAYTIDAAYVLGLEKRIGSLKVGKLADLIILEKDLHKVPSSELSTTRVQLTMMNGRITFREGL